jgi:hypothetical protein
MMVVMAKPAHLPTTINLTFIQKQKEKKGNRRKRRKKSKRKKKSQKRGMISRQHVFGASIRCGNHNNNIL